jgi:hypothetical protein
MPLPRVQLFEFNDSPWVPVATRESLVEALSRTLVWARVLRGLTAPFAAFIEQTGAREVLDLCAGAWDVFVSTLRMYTEAELREMVAPVGKAFRWWDVLLPARRLRVLVLRGAGVTTCLPE